MTAPATESASARPAEDDVSRLWQGFLAPDDAARPRVLEELRQLRRTAQAERPQVQPEAPRGDPLRAGSTVEVPAYGATGQVLDVRGDELVVQLGLMKVNVRRRDVRMKAEVVPAKTKVRTSFVGTAPSNFQAELQLRGQHVEAADAVHRHPQGVPHRQPGDDPDAQTGEGSRPVADDHAREVGRHQPGRGQARGDERADPLGVGPGVEVRLVGEDVGVVVDGDGDRGGRGVDGEDQHGTPSFQRSP